MGDNIATVEINGHEYYVPVDSVDYLCVIDGYLVYVGTGSLTLYGSIRDTTIGTSGYPRITMQSYSRAMYQSSLGANTSVLQVNSFEIKNRYTNTNTLLLVVIAVVLIFSWFKGR